MVTTYDPIDRLAILTPLDPAVRNIWGLLVDQWPILGAQGAKGFTTIGLSGTAVSLSTANNAVDQERYFGWAFTGALSADCTVTVPDVRRAGIAINGTSGGFNVLIKTTGAPIITLVPGEAALWANIIGIPLVYLSNGRLSRTVTQGAPVALVNGVLRDITSIALPLGGFWEASGIVGFNISVSANNVVGWVNSVSATQPEERAQITGPTMINGTRLTISPVVFAGGSTVYLSGFAAFATGTASAFGSLHLRKLGGS